MNGWRMPLLLAQDDAAAAGAVAALFGGAMLFIWLLVLVVVIAGMWKAFEKAGKPGWGAIVPIYNLILLCEIAGRPLWWFVLLIIPCVGVVMLLIVNIDIAKKFGMGAGFGVVLWLFPFIGWPILGFGGSRYDASAT
jgi:hypothetical protein